MTEQLLGELHSLLNILLAVVLGFAIGYERKLRYKEAGIRTHTIVCVGSALIMVVSKYGFADIMEYDASRVAAQIVSGIGFLGAGIIIYRKHEIHGLTTDLARTKARITDKFVREDIDRRDVRHISSILRYDQTAKFAYIQITGRI